MAVHLPPFRPRQPACPLDHCETHSLKRGEGRRGEGRGGKGRKYRRKGGREGEEEGRSGDERGGRGEGRGERKGEEVQEEGREGRSKEKGR